MDNLPWFSSRNARFADSFSNNSQSVSVTSENRPVISFRFTHPSKFSIAIKYRERRRVAFASMNQKGKGNGHWPGAVRRGWPVWRRRCKERDETHACHDGRSIFSWCSNAIPKTISQTMYAEPGARARLWRIDQRGRLRKENERERQARASRRSHFILTSSDDKTRWNVGAGLKVFIKPYSQSFGEAGSAYVSN